MSNTQEPNIIAVLAIGFHHKKGCQVEYCYPVMVPGSPTELPPAWHHLPGLALPDGSHNYLSDTIFFHLPGLENPVNTVYGVSCFRQIPIEHVTQKTSDMTRSSVQKSVCVISRIPAYGRLAVKLELVTRAWFIQGDFGDTKLLEDAYKNLVACPLDIEQSLEGLCSVKLLEAWTHKLVLLVKLLLLQRRVVMYGVPAGQLSRSLLSLVSLLPHCVERGLSQSALLALSRPLSPKPKENDTNGYSDPEANITLDNCEEMLETESKKTPITENKDDNINKEQKTINQEDNINKEQETFSIDDKERTMSFDDNILGSQKDEVTLREKCHSVGEKYRNSRDSAPISRDISVDGLNNLLKQIDLSSIHFPLNVFVDGYMCLPYLSLQYMDLLSDPAVKGFVVGASNVLFKQKRHLFDVLIDINDMKIETSELSLKRQLQLTTEDLRFADHLVRHGASQGDGWIRDQIMTYILYLLRTSLLPEGSRELETYNGAFMSAFKATDCYRHWAEGSDSVLTAVQPGHPFGGQLSVADMKLRLAHTMSNTEGGRKVTAAVASTGRAVAASSRAVGGALSHAKGALSVWWTNFTAPVPATGAGLATEGAELPESTQEGAGPQKVEPIENASDATEAYMEESSGSGKVQLV